jgi:alpha-glucosidase
MRHARSLVLLVVLAFVPAGAFAGWNSVGAVSAPTRDGDALVFHGPQYVVSVSVLGPEAIRVRLAPTKEFGRDHSYAVVSKALGSTQATFDIQPARSVITTSALKVTIGHDPFRVSFATADGESLDEDDAERGTAIVGKSTRVWKRLRDDEHVYGFGEKNGRLDKRGNKLGGYSYTMWNSDTFGYMGDTDPIYASVPFFLVLRNGRTHGIFLDNTSRTTFDVGRESQSMLSFGAAEGDLDYYFLYGPTPRQVVERYTTLTGHMPMPPRWALGFNQCRYSYYPESKVRFIAENFRQRRIPADVIWLDIHYLDGFAPFTWDPVRFPDPKGLISDLRADGFHTVTILDAHPEAKKGTVPYDTGLAGDFFVKNPDGSVYTAPVWPSQAEKDANPSVFPDFSKPAAREWWGGLYKILTDVGVAGIWNDMNEPAVFETPTGTMPLDVVHDNEGEPTSHRAIHNVYGLLNTRATYEGLQRLRPDARPFVLTRATYAGGQRYAAIWPGDNVSDWTAMRDTIPMFSNMGLSGFTFLGADIGGFADAPTPELFTRWLQMGVFYPFMRVHTTFGTPDQEPWSFGVRYEELNRRAIELRYELLPQIYNVMEEASRTGIPALRPLLLEYPDDKSVYGREDEFLFGSDLLVAPVLREAASKREVYLPAGDWFDFWTGTRHEGGRSMDVSVNLDTVPVYVRGGALVFRQPVVQHTGEMPGQPLIVGVYGDRGAGQLYEDDGETLGNTRGVFSRRRFDWSRTGTTGTLTASAPEGPYRPAARDLVLELRGATAPSAITADGQALTHLAAGAKSGAGWTVDDDGVVRVRVPDRFAAMKVDVTF